MSGDGMMLEINWSVVLERLDKFQPILVAFVGFGGAVAAALVASNRETRRTLALKRHDAIVEAAKVLWARADVCRQMLQIADSGIETSDASIKLQILFSLFRQLAEQQPLDRVVLGARPYVKDIPQFDYDAQKDLSRVIAFGRDCEKVVREMQLRGATMPSESEMAELRNSINSLRETFHHEYDRAEKLANFLSSRL